MTVELWKHYGCISEPQGIIGMTLVCLGYLKYFVIIFIIVFYCIYFRNTRHVNHEEQVRTTIQESDEYLTNHIAPMPLSETCSICMEENSHETTVGLDCGHFFHKKCLTDWIRIRGSCPMCRRQLFNWITIKT